MENKIINLPTLISKVASEAGVDPVTARRFIHELFAQIEVAVTDGEHISVDGIGEFSPVTTGANGGEGTVRFVAADSLAAAANRPFSAFAPVEVNDGAEEEILGEPAETSAPEVSPAPIQDYVVPPVIDTLPETAPVPAPQPSAVSDPQPSSAISESADEPAVMTPSEPAPQPSSEPADESDNYSALEEAPAPASSPSTSLWLILGIMIGLIIGLVGGYFAGKEMGRTEVPYDDTYLTGTDAEEEEPDEPVVEVVTADESVAVVAETTSQPAEPAKSELAPAQPVYDTVTKSLAKLAYDHYGVSDYWIFIYNANPNLGDPKKIASGTKVLIPPYESFAGATKEETNAKMRQLLNELSKTYKL